MLHALPTSTSSGTSYTYFFELESSDDVLMPQIYSVYGTDYNTATAGKAEMIFEVREGPLGLPWYRKTETAF
jgi:hypothetical protein